MREDALESKRLSTLLPMLKELVSHQAFLTDAGLPASPGGCLNPSGSPEKNEGVCQWLGL